jgi:hypothetical protein
LNDNTRIFMAPPDTPPTGLPGHVSGDWTPLGYIAPDGITVDREEDVYDGIFPGEQVRMIKQVNYRIGLSNQALGALYGSLPPAPTYAVLVTYDIPYQPPHAPRKGWDGVGKTYRRARRSYAKAMRAWKRAGKPLTQRCAIHMPHAYVEAR